VKEAVSTRLPAVATGIVLVVLYAVTVVGGMLTLAKADSGDAIPKNPLRLDAIARDAVRSASPRAAEKGLVLEFDANSMPATIFGDANLIRQLTANLIDNAIKFTDAGSVTVRTRATEADAALEVNDTGPGITPAELDLIFDRFYRADKSRNRDIAGTGLGLAIVRSIARAHGGRVQAHAAPEGGTIFSVTFPRAGDRALTQD